MAIGAQRVGRQAEGIDITSLLPCAVAAKRQAALDALRPAVAQYGGFFPRYNRLIAESGFPEAATRAAPDAVIESTGIVGTATECRERIEAYRHSGIALPIINPRGDGVNPKQGILVAIKACAP